MITEGAVRAANTALYDLGFMVRGWNQLTPAQIVLVRVERRLKRWPVVDTTAAPVVVEEPYPEFFPSEVFLQRVMVLA